MGSTHARLASLGRQSPPEPTRRWGISALGVVIGAALGAGLAILPTIDSGSWSAGAGVDSQQTEWPVRELDREWRWTPKGVEFEFMFRTVDAGSQLSWLAHNRS